MTHRKTILIMSLISFLTVSAFSGRKSKNEHTQEQNNKDISISFIIDNENYEHVWSDKSGTMKEYTRKGEGIKTWTRMITTHNYQGIKVIGEPISAYMTNVKPYLALKPEILKSNNSEMKEDLVLILVLLAPEKTHYEYVIARYIQNQELEIKSVIYSQKIPFKDNVDFSSIIKKQNSLIGQISKLKI